MNRFCEKNEIFICTIQKKVVTLQPKSEKMSTAQAIASEQILSAMGTMVEDDRKVSAVINYILMLKQQDEKPLIDPNWQTQATISHEEFWEQLYHEVGALYGLNDIREAKEWVVTVLSI